MVTMPQGHIPASIPVIACTFKLTTIYDITMHDTCSTTVKLGLVFFSIALEHIRATVALSESPILCLRRFIEFCVQQVIP